VNVEISNLGTQHDYLYSQPTYDKLSLKGVWLWSHDQFKFSVPPKIPSNFVHCFATWLYSIVVTNCPL